MIDSVAQDQLTRALARAKADELVAYYVNSSTFVIPNKARTHVYYITITGRDAFDLFCTCPTPSHIMCKHRALVAHDRKFATYQPYSAYLALAD